LGGWYQSARLEPEPSDHFGEHIRFLLQTLAGRGALLHKCWTPLDHDVHVHHCLADVRGGLSPADRASWDRPVTERNREERARTAAVHSFPAAHGGTGRRTEGQLPDHHRACARRWRPAPYAAELPAGRGPAPSIRPEKSMSTNFREPVNAC